MNRYASSTAVSSEKSKAEIERTLTRYGATHFAYTSMPEGAVVQFVKAGKRIRFLLPLPDKADKKFWLTPSGRRRVDEVRAHSNWEQAGRQRWRALALVIKAKLEAVEAGICTFEEEFLAHIVLPNGQTAGQAMIPQINEAYATGKVPSLGWEG